MIFTLNVSGWKDVTEHCLYERIRLCVSEKRSMAMTPKFYSKVTRNLMTMNKHSSRKCLLLDFKHFRHSAIIKIFSVSLKTLFNNSSFFFVRLCITNAQVCPQQIRFKSTHIYFVIQPKRHSLTDFTNCHLHTLPSI